jgi:hypothetical protein
MLANKALSAAPSAVPVYVEDVFSTYIYTGTAATQTITNNIDLSGEGGLVWIKNRANTGYDHALFDTARGVNKQLKSNTTGAETTYSGSLTAFTTSGFTLGADSSGGYVNDSTTSHVSWTFRKQEKFFDVVTYTGDGANRTISHNLGSVPGCMIVKRTDISTNWIVYHRSLTDATRYLVLNNTSAEQTLATVWNSTAPTSTVFSLGTNGSVNASGGIYVAYLFAHDAGGFGASGSDNVISCGSFTTDGSGNATVDLGYEPQWIMFKASSDTGDWDIIDNMRGWVVGGVDSNLKANTSAAESAGFDRLNPTATGFASAAGVLSVSTTYIYIAIRRGPMKTPTTGTSVFEPVAYSGTSANNRIITASITPDLVTWANRDSTGDRYEYDRLRGSGTWLKPNTTGAEGADGTTYGVQFNKVQTGYQQGTADGGFLNSSSNYVNWQFRRAPGFFDVVCYTGTGANRTVSHNLGVAPELVILKRRNSAENWPVLQTNIPTQATLNGTFSGDPPNSSYFGNGTSYVAPTSTVFSVGTNSAVNASGGTYVAYLFASLSGVSKVGSYTGNGSSVTVTTNFQPRFILVKRTDSTGNWIVGDSARGLVSADEPALFLNSTAAETTGQDWVDVSSTGFTVNETALNANVNTGTYIYLAIA